MTPSTHCSQCNKELSTNSEHGLCRYCLLFQALEPTSELEHFPESIGGYKLQKQIGRGGMGVVFSAIQPDLNREVAVKLVLDGKLAGTEEKVRFLQEIEYTAQLDHPSIIPIYDSGEEGGYLYYSSKFIKGGTLSEFIDSQSESNDTKDLSDKDAAQLIRAISSAIQHGHSRGIIHRDIKPSNILLDQNHNPYLSDFGLARSENLNNQLTRSSDMVGSPHYLAPEVIQSNTISTSIDIYSIGVVLYQLLTHQTPFLGDSLPKIFDAILHKPPTFSSTSYVDKSLQAVCLKCLRKSPGERYRSAQELVDDIDRFLENKPVLATTPSPVTKSLLFAKRHPVPVTLATLLVCLGMVTLFLSIFSASQAKKAAEAATLAEIESSKKEQASRWQQIDILLDRANNTATHDKLDKAASLLLQAAELSHDNTEKKEFALDLLASWSPHHPKSITLAAKGDVAIEFSPDSESNLFATFRSDDNCIIWHTPQSPNKQHTWKHHSIVNHCCFSKDGQLAATISYTEARIYDVKSGKLIAEIINPSDTPLIPAVNKSPNRIAFNHDESHVIIAFAHSANIKYDLHTGQHQRLPLPSFATESRANGWITEIISTPKHTILSYFKGVQVIGPDKKSVMIPSSGRTHDIDVSKDLHWLAIADGSSVAKLYSLSDLQKVSEFPHKYMTTGVAFNHTGKLLISTSRDRTAQVWDLAQYDQPKLIATQKYPAACIGCQWLGNSEIIATSCEDGTIRFFAPPYYRSFTSYSAQAGIPYHFALSNQSDRLIHLAIGTYTGKVILQNNLSIPPAHTQSQSLIRKFSYNPNSNKIIALSDLLMQERETQVLSLDSGKNQSHRLPLNGSNKSSSLSSDGQYCATGLKDGSVKVFNTENNKLVHTTDKGDSMITVTAVNENLVTYYDLSMNLRIHNFKQKKQLGHLKLKQEVSCMTLSPDGKYLAFAQGIGYIKVVRTTDMKLIFNSKHPRHSNTILALAFNSDGSKLCSGGMDRLAKIWDISKETQVGADLLNRDYIWEIAFNHDDKIIATAGQERCIRFWDSKTGYQLGAPITHSHWVNGLCFALVKGEEKLITCSNDRKIRALALPRRSTKSLQQWQQWLKNKASFSTETRK